MSRIRARKDGRLFFDFYYRGERCRELSALPDTPANCRKMMRVLATIDAEIASDTFDYGRAFPNSKKARRLARTTRSPAGPVLALPSASTTPAVPTFAVFTRTWKLDKEVEWRTAYRSSVESILDTHLLPTFGDVALDEIDRAAVLEFRSELAGGRLDPHAGRNGPSRRLSAATVNRIMGILRMILDEAALRFGIANPCTNVKRLKVQRTDISPFTPEEMNAILRRVRKDYRPYLTFRFLTGVRSGEAHGLKWKYVDFERDQVLIRETFQGGRTEYTKTDGSQREIQMSQPVRAALLEMCPQGYLEAPGKFADQYVFCTRHGHPIDNSNFTERVWKPLLRNLGLNYRRPYEMRHACATLWLAAGESPEWIARQLGHTTTEMLFRTYSRYVPNLVRRDGAAFDTLVAGIVNGAVKTGTSVDADNKEESGNE